MHVVSLLRSVAGGPRRGPIGVLAILTVIFGVVTMHSMSGSPTAHVHHVPHGEAPVVTAQPATAERVAAARTTAEQDATARLTAAGDVSVRQAPESRTPGEREVGACHDGCGGHDLTTAMCLMILVALLALVVPARRLLWRSPLLSSAAMTPVFTGVRAVAAPSLHELCISRT